MFLVLLFEFRNFSAPISILASAVLSTAGVFVALLLAGITFNLSSFMGLIMVIGIVAKNGILLLDADKKFRMAGFSREEVDLSGRPQALAPDRDDGDRSSGGNVASGASHWRGFANVPALGHCGYRRSPDRHDPFPFRYPHDLLLHGQENITATYMARKT